MGCFIACLGGTKKRKHLKSSRIQTLNPNSHNDSGLGSYQQLQSVSAKRDDGEACSDLKTEKPTLRSVFEARKKVTFNLNVRTYELISSKDYLESDENDEVAPKYEKVSHEGIKKEPISAYPSNYRYKNFIEFEEDDDGVDEDQDEADEFDDCLEDCDEDDDHNELYHSIDGTMCIETNDDERFKNAHSVLCPVENTTQWKAVKAKKALPQSSLKQENVAADERTHTSMQQEISVDASLSVWIGGNGHQHNLIKARTI